MWQGYTQSNSDNISSVVFNASTHKGSNVNDSEKRTLGNALVNNVGKTCRVPFTLHWLVFHCLESVLNLEFLLNLFSSFCLPKLSFNNLGP